MNVVLGVGVHPVPHSCFRPLLQRTGQWNVTSKLQRTGQWTWMSLWLPVCLFVSGLKITDFESSNECSALTRNDPQYRFFDVVLFLYADWRGWKVWFSSLPFSGLRDVHEHFRWKRVGRGSCFWVVNIWGVTLGNCAVEWDLNMTSKLHLPIIIPSSLKMTMMHESSFHSKFSIHRS